MIVSVYGMGEGYATIPFFMKICMHLSYLRYAMEGLVGVMLQGRKKVDYCPEDFCLLARIDKFLSYMAMDNAIFWIDILVLLFAVFGVRLFGFYLLKRRLLPNKTSDSLNYLGRLIKSYVNH